jgi:hypothetical protein
VIFKILGLAMFPALAFGGTAYGPELQGFDYPYPVARFEFSSQQEQMHTAYMEPAFNPASISTHWSYSGFQCPV